MLTEDQVRTFVIAEVGVMKTAAFEQLREGYTDRTWPMRRQQIARCVAVGEIERLAERGLPYNVDSLDADSAVALARQLRADERRAAEHPLRESHVPVRPDGQPLLVGPSREQSRQREAMRQEWNEFVTGLPTTDDAIPTDLDGLRQMGIPLRESATATTSSPRETARAVLQDLDERVPAHHEDRARVDQLKRRGAVLAADEAEEIVKLGRRHLALPPIMGGGD